MPGFSLCLKRKIIHIVLHEIVTAFCNNFAERNYILMKKNIWMLFILLIAFQFVKANKIDTTQLYDPSANAEAGIAKAVMQAKKEHKHVLIEAGGNWCVWCLRFNNFVKATPQVDSIINANYIVYHLNYSKENKNAEVMAKYGFPQRFGFPVFIILDANGNRIHTQNSGYLEQNKWYSAEKVAEFLNNWTPAAIDPKNYKE